MAAPIDGYGIYESIRPTDATIGTRLSVIASLGNKLVLNYALLFGHVTDLTNYINTAQSNGLKVIVALSDPAIWDGTTNINTKYPNLISDWGGSGTDYAGFSTFLVNQLKGLSGVWGWYVGDETPNSNHSLMLTHANVIKAADSTHPRLFIASGTNVAGSFGSGACIFGDCADVIGDDFYPIGVSNNAAGEPSFANEYAGIQTYANAHGLQSAAVLQAWGYHQTNTNNSMSFYPGDTPYIYREELRQQRDFAIANMNPRLILWYYFPYIYDAAFTVDGARQQADYAWAVSGIGAADPVIARDNFLRIQSPGLNPASDGETWSNPSNFTLSCYGFYGKIAIPGAAAPGYILLDVGTCYNPNFLYRWFVPHNADEVGPVMNYTGNGANLVRVEVSNGTMVIARYVNGVRTYVSSTVAITIAGSTAYWGRVTSNAGTYTVKVWADGTVEPGSPQLTWTDVNYVATAGQYGMFAFLNSSINAAYINSFEVYVSSINNVYSVAVGGSDSNPGTLASPFATIQQALNVVVPGDTINVGTGVFIPSNPTYGVSGSTIAPITIVSLVPFANVPPAAQNYVYIPPARAIFPPAVRRSGVFPVAKRRQS